MLLRFCVKLCARKCTLSDTVALNWCLFAGNMQHKNKKYYKCVCFPIIWSNLQTFNCSKHLKCPCRPPCPTSTQKSSATKVAYTLVHHLGQRIFALLRSALGTVRTANCVESVAFRVSRPHSQWETAVTVPQNAVDVNVLSCLWRIQTHSPLTLASFTYIFVGR